MKLFFYYLAVCALFLSSCSQENKTAFVNLSTLYEKFPLKKQLESNLMQLQSTRKAALDSIYLKMSDPASNRAETEKQFIEKRQFFEDDIERLTQQYDDNIWKQINQYVQDYGREKSYDYIFGTDGTGSIMYAGEKHDITEDVSEYINARYQGAKK